MTEYQSETSRKEFVKVHVEYKDKDGNVYSMNDVEVPVEASVKNTEETSINTEETSINTEETNAVFSPEVQKILKGVGLSEHKEN